MDKPPLKRYKSDPAIIQVTHITTKQSIFSKALPFASGALLGLVSLSILSDMINNKPVGGHQEMYPQLEILFLASLAKTAHVAYATGNIGGSFTTAAKNVAYGIGTSIGLSVLNSILSHFTDANTNSLDNHMMRN
jgi:hypothetical protein